jgi:hypothetical protein
MLQCCVPSPHDVPERAETGAGVGKSNRVGASVHFPFDFPSSLRFSLMPIIRFALFRTPSFPSPFTLLLRGFLEMAGAPESAFDSRCFGKHRAT